MSPPQTPSQTDWSFLQARADPLRTGIDGHVEDPRRTHHNRGARSRRRRRLRKRRDDRALASKRGWPLRSSRTTMQEKLIDPEFHGFGRAATDESRLLSLSHDQARLRSRSRQSASSAAYQRFDFRARPVEAAGDANLLSRRTAERRRRCAEHCGARATLDTCRANSRTACCDSTSYCRERTRRCSSTYEHSSC